MIFFNFIKKIFNNSKRDPRTVEMTDEEIEAMWDTIRDIFDSPDESTVPAPMDNFSDEENKRQ